MFRALGQPIMNGFRWLGRFVMLFCVQLVSGPTLEERIVFLHFGKPRVRSVLATGNRMETCSCPLRRAQDVGTVNITTVARA